MAYKTASTSVVNRSLARGADVWSMLPQDTLHLSAFSSSLLAEMKVDLVLLGMAAVTK